VYEGFRWLVSAGRCQAGAGCVEVLRTRPYRSAAFRPAGTRDVRGGGTAPRRAPGIVRGSGRDDRCGGGRNRL